MKTPLLLLAAPALLIAGCAGTQNRGLESVHQPVVSRSDFVLDLNLAGSALAPGESQRLRGWVEAMQPRYGDKFAVQDADGQASAARAQVGALIASQGLTVSNQDYAPTGAMASGIVRVVLSRFHASVPGCPDFTRDSSHDFNQNTPSNHGCAINGNLAAMVANPGDLVSGHPGAPTIDMQSSGKAIGALRKAAPTGAGGTVLLSAGTK